MRARLGAAMTLDDYDEVITTFLANQQLERALTAFVDMMTEGAIDLAAAAPGGLLPTPLPALLANKFFFGKWIKRLVLTDNLDGAYAVVRFMARFRLKPAPIAVNTLIGAWQRMGGTRDIELADRTAWEMVHARIHHVRSRAISSHLQRTSPSEAVSPSASLSPPISPPTIRLMETVFKPNSDAPALPPANIETFLLLAESYRQRGLHSRVVGLWDALLDCELMPDTRLMNKLLNSYARAHDADGARALYDVLVREHSVPPDAHSLDTLWWLLAINRHRILTDDARVAEMPAARALFAEVLRVAPALGGTIHDGLARTILHTLRRLGDGVGVVVALRALRARFAFVPSDMLAVEINMGTTDLSLESLEGRNRIRGGLRELVRAVRHMRARAKQLARARGEDGAEWEAKPAGELIAAFLEARMLPRDVGEDEFWAVAREMGAAQLLARGGGGGDGALDGAGSGAGGAGALGGGGEEEDEHRGVEQEGWDHEGEGPGHGDDFDLEDLGISSPAGEEQADHHHASSTTATATSAPSRYGAAQKKKTPPPRGRQRGEVEKIKELMYMVEDD
jgi:hypothetical protein